MKIVKPSKAGECYRCNERINSGEMRFTNKAGYLHMLCKRKADEVGIGNYCLPKWLGDHLFWYDKYHYDLANREVQASTWLEF